jgi:hypothetical protein
MFSEYSLNTPSMFLECSLNVCCQGGISRKGISTERTFSAITAWPLLRAKCEELAQALSEDMHREGLWAKTLTLKLKTTDFQVKTASLVGEFTRGTLEGSQCMQLMVEPFCCTGISTLTIIMINNHYYDD